MPRSEMWSRVALARIYVSENVPSSLIIATLMMTAICSYETSVLTRPSRRHIPEDGIFRSQRREDLKSYVRDAIPDYWHLPSNPRIA
jgi:hypothetical protein